MKINEIKRVIEEVVRVEYIAEDGRIFNKEEECKKYEESDLFILSNKLKRLNSNTSIYDFNDEGSEECELEIFDVQTEEDLSNLRNYLHLKAIYNGASEKDIKDAFTSIENEKRKDFVFDGVTIGHEVMVFWDYDSQWFWVYKDGSLNGYIEYIKEKYSKIITPKKDN